MCITNDEDTNFVKFSRRDKSDRARHTRLYYMEGKHFLFLSLGFQPLSDDDGQYGASPEAGSGDGGEMCFPRESGTRVGNRVKTSAREFQCKGRKEKEGTEHSGRREGPS